MAWQEITLISVLAAVLIYTLFWVMVGFDRLLWLAVTIARYIKRKVKKDV
jgi:hypothetical protein